MRSFLIVHPAGRTASKTEPAAPDGAGVQTCYQRACGYAPGHLGSDNPVLALSRRRCRATVYTSSAVPGFPNMLLSPRLFRSRSAGSPRSPCPELRPPEVAIRFVRDMAHSFPALGFPVGPQYFDRADLSSPTAGRTNPKVVICFPRLVCWRSVRTAYPGNLHPVRPITVRHLATILPLSSVSRAGIFAPLAGQAISEFPDSTMRCVLAPRSCLLDAGGPLEPSATRFYSSQPSSYHFGYGVVSASFAIRS
jgi:hypothetical protein